jgi:hypothetical protein
VPSAEEEECMQYVNNEHQQWLDILAEEDFLEGSKVLAACSLDECDACLEQEGDQELD